MTFQNSGNIKKKKISINKKFQVIKPVLYHRTVTFSRIFIFFTAKTRLQQLLVIERCYELKIASDNLKTCWVFCRYFYAINAIHWTIAIQAIDTIKINAKVASDVPICSKIIGIHEECIDKRLKRRAQHRVNENEWVYFGHNRSILINKRFVKKKLISWFIRILSFFHHGT